MKEKVLSSIEAQKKKAAASLKASRSQALWGTLITGALILVAICGSVFLGIFTYRRIGRRLARLQANFDSMAKGNLNVALTDDYNDEIGTVEKSARAMARSLGDTIGAIRSHAGVLSVVGVELKDGSEKAAHGAKEQAFSATQIATAAEEMSQTIADIARNAASAKETTDNAFEAAQGGQKTAGRTVFDVEGISSATHELSDMIAGLNGKVAEIGSIVTVINDIADQTNLLALNAAIEAARAGEQGRGFAVVADEVRKLAERTIGATAQISSMIQLVKSESDKTTDSMAAAASKVSAALESIAALSSSLDSVVANVQNAQGQIIQIATAVDEQSATAEEIASNVTETSNVAGKMRHMSGDVMINARSLAIIAEELKGAAAMFDTGNDQLEFDLAKIRHLLFLEKINGCLDGIAEIRSEDLPDHHGCAFGKWYYSEGKARCSSLGHFGALEEPHMRVHKLAKEAVDAFSDGNGDKAVKIREELEGVSRALIGLIMQTKHECAAEHEK